MTALYSEKDEAYLDHLHNLWMEHCKNFSNHAAYRAWYKKQQGKDVIANMARPTYDEWYKEHYEKSKKWLKRQLRAEEEEKRKAEKEQKKKVEEEQKKKVASVPPKRGGLGMGGPLRPIPVKIKRKYYAVAKGRKVGIYATWDECRKHVDGFKGARYMRFNTKKKAMAFVVENRESA